MKKFLAVVAVAALCFGLIAEDAFARRGGGFGGGRSGGFRSSPSRSTPSRSSGWGSRSSSSSSRSSSSSKPKATAPKTQTNALSKSKVDSRTYEKAKTSGKAFTTRSAAATDFKSRVKSDPKTRSAVAKQYPTKYDSKPATRPSHIPATYNNQTVIYQNGGYGYMNNGAFTALTTYMLLDTLSDAQMNRAMAQQGYYVGQPVVATSAAAFSIFWVVLLVCVAGGLLVLMVCCND